jgi:hypothetical protein
VPRHPSLVPLASNVAGAPPRGRILVLLGAQEGAQRWDVPGSTFCRWRWVSISEMSNLASRQWARREALAMGIAGPWAGEGGWLA